MSTLKKFLKALDTPRYNRRLARLHRQVFGNKEGQELLADYIIIGNLLDSPDCKTEREAGIVEGQRRIVQRMLTFLNVNPEGFMPIVERQFEE